MQNTQYILPVLQSTFSLNRRSRLHDFAFGLKQKNVASMVWWRHYGWGSNTAKITVHVRSTFALTYIQALYWTKYWLTAELLKKCKKKKKLKASLKNMRVSFQYLVQQNCWILAGGNVTQTERVTVLIYHLLLPTFAGLSNSCWNYEVWSSNVKYV